MKVLCEHTMCNTNFICEDGRFPVLRNVPVWLDKEIADKYPSTFKIIREEAAPLPEAEELDADADIEPAKEHAIEYEATAARYEPDPGVKMVDDDIVDEVIEMAKAENDEFDPDGDIEFSSVPAELDAKLADIDDEATAIPEEVKIDNDDEATAIPEEVKIDLLKAIESFTSKKKLDAYAEELGVKLDRRKSLKSMRLELKKEWNLI
jgi:hypothetical protein